MSTHVIITDKLRGGTASAPILSETKFRYDSVFTFDHPQDIPDMATVQAYIEASTIPVNSPIFGWYSANTSQLTPSAVNGDLVWNNATQEIATQLYFAYFDRDGNTMGDYLEDAIVGSIIYLIGADAGKYQKWKVTARAVMMDHVRFTVSSLANVHQFISGENVNVFFTVSPGSDYIVNNVYGIGWSGDTTRGASRDSLYNAFALFAKLSGATFSGPVILDADPTAALGAVTKQYADSLVLGLWDDRGNYTPTGGLYPSTGGSGTAGAILKGDVWTISGLGAGVTALVGTVTVKDGDSVRSLVNTPGQTDINWAEQAGELGYTPLTNTLASGKINVGNGSNTAAPVTPSGAVSMNNAGVFSLIPAFVYTAVIATWAPGSGVIANGDSLQQVLQKLSGNISALLTLPAYPGNDNQIYELTIINGVVSWTPKTYVKGTSVANKAKLQADLTSDWDSSQSYIGTTSGAITASKGGEKYKGQGGNGNWYVYEALGDNEWTRYLMQ